MKKINVIIDTDLKQVTVECENKTLSSCAGDSRFDDQETRNHWIWQLLRELVGAYDFSETWRQEYELEPEIYDIWYHHQFYIDGEDAREYIQALGLRYYGDMHSLRIQSYGGIREGWKYYKILRDHRYNGHTAANLAYWRGYIEAMDWNSPWDKEGTEVLDLMDLERK